MSAGDEFLPELRGRNVLLTGHSGFKGAWLATLLADVGSRVDGFARAPDQEPSLHCLLGRGAPPWGYGDVRDPAAVTRAFEESQPEVVLHLAAQPLVRRSYGDPVGTFSTNVQGTVHVLEAARACPSVRAVVVVTSDKCYRNDGGGRRFREDDPLGGDDPYSASKAAAEVVTAAYRHSFFSRADPPVGVATARAGNVIGGGDWSEDRLLPDLVRAIGAGQPLTVRYPEAVRPWQHVLDVCYGYARLAAALVRDPARHARAWNFAPAEDGLPVRGVVDLALARFGSSLGWRPATEAQPQEAETLRLDSTQARTELSWRSRLSTEEAVSWTVDWYRALASGRPALDLCREQWAAFAQRLGQA
jgi:CDP-glucose 4,6-dehydratase